MLLVSFALAFLAVLLLFNLTLTFGLIRRVNQKESIESIQPLGIGEQAPPITAETVQGKTFDSNDLNTFGMLLVFVSPDCLPCASKIDEIANLVPRVESSQKSLVLISDGGVVETQELLASTETIDPLLDSRLDNRIWRDYKVPGTPFFYFISNRRQVSASGYIGTDFTGRVEAWLNSADSSGQGS